MFALKLGISALGHQIPRLVIILVHRNHALSFVLSLQNQPQNKIDMTWRKASLQE